MNVLEEKQRDAEKCLQIAENAYSNGNLDKAEKMSSKAERLYPTTLAKNMLLNIKAARGQSSEEHSSSSSVSSSNSETNHKSVSDNINSAEKCIDIAKEAILKGDLNKAKGLLLKSERIFQTDSAKDLLQEISDIEASNSNYSGARLDVTANKENAEKYIEFAQNDIAAGHFSKAKRLLMKAERIFPSARAKDLIQQIRDAREQGIEEKPIEIKIKTKQKEVEKQKRREPTPEQIEAISRVTRSGNDYEILGLDRGSSLSCVTKAYRQLTLLLHPDKNKAPGAKEAFMIVLEATDRLKKQLKVNH